MVATYIVLPAATAILFGVAALPPLIALARSSLLLAAVVAVLWLVLLVALVWDGHVENVVAFAALLTFALTRVVAAELSRVSGWSVELVEVGVVELVMGVLALANQILRWRRRDR